MKYLVSLLLVGWSLLSGQAQIRLPYFFGDDMVLQRNQPIRFWGWAPAQTSFQVELAGLQQTVRADVQGHWRVSFPAHPAGGPYTLKVGRELIYRNILIGDVWLCSGQSNMQWMVRESFNAPYELSKANLPKIRSFTINRAMSSQPLENPTASSWKVCTPENAATFSAVAYFFAKEIQLREKVPIGIIHSSWGGTAIEPWMGKEAFEHVSAFKSQEAEKVSEPAVESVQAAYTQALVQYQRQVQQLDVGYREQWYAPAYQARDWKTLVAPGFWEEQGLPDFDGVVWLRKEVSLPACWVGKDLLVNLETLNTTDSTFFNGTLIGKTTWAPGRRMYVIPKERVKAGKNLMVIRVENSQGRGGFSSKNAADLRIQELVESAQPLIVPLSGEWQYRESITAASYLPKPAEPVQLRRQRAGIYNAMIAPLRDLALRGVLWYQGESNVGYAETYLHLLPALIEHWRKQFRQPNLPFLIVQLAGHGPLTPAPVREVAVAELREAQLLTATSVPNVGLAVTIDVGNPDDVHPTNKQVVGQRLAAEARRIVYGETDLQTSPLYQSMHRQGNTIRLRFSNAKQGLVAKNGSLKGFAIAGVDQKFHWAQARIEGSEVIVWSDQVAEPTQVRYAWAASPVESNGANLYNQKGFPASPFRTLATHELSH